MVKHTRIVGKHDCRPQGCGRVDQSDCVPLVRSQPAPNKVLVSVLLILILLLISFLLLGFEVCASFG